MGREMAMARVMECWMDEVREKEVGSNVALSNK